MSILEEIFANKRQEVVQAIQTIPLPEMRAEAARMAPANDFIKALRTARLRNNFPALIAEMKAASPSRGELVKDLDVLQLAQMYIANGAAAISVLTEEQFFKGHLDHLRQVRMKYPGFALLRKDFIFDPYQVYEARAAGADAVLLIVAGLEASQLVELQTLTHRLGMAALIEVHTQSELITALDCHANLIGINNRDLHTFQTSLETTLQLRPFVLPGITIVAESGIDTPADVALLNEARVDSILVGEALVTAPDVPAKVRALSGQATRPLNNGKKEY